VPPRQSTVKSPVQIFAFTPRLPTVSRYVRLSVRPDARQTALPPLLPTPLSISSSRCSLSASARWLGARRYTVCLSTVRALLANHSSRLLLCSPSRTVSVPPKFGRVPRTPVLFASVPSFFSLIVVIQLKGRKALKISSFTF